MKKLKERYVKEAGGQLSVLPKFTNSAIIIHIINYFNLNVKTVFKY